MFVCSLAQIMSALGQVSIPLSQVFASLVQLGLQFLQLWGLMTNVLLVCRQTPLQLWHTATQLYTRLFHMIILFNWRRDEEVDISNKRLYVTKDIKGLQTHDKNKLIHPPWLRVFSCCICWDDPAGLCRELMGWLGLMGVSSWVSQRDVPLLFRGVSTTSWNGRLWAWSCCHGNMEEPAWRAAISLWPTLAEDWFSS